MSVTTIKVSVETRDRLKQQARAAGMPIGAYVAQLSEAAGREERMAALGLAIARTSAADLASHAEESRAGESAELSDAQ